MPDSQFGPYRLIQQIAVGGMAEIHLAKTKGIAGFEKFVALKMIHPNFSEDQQFIEMLIDEAKLTVQLQHVNIAQTFDLGRVDNTFYITMEFVDGADLYKLLRRGSEKEVDVPFEVAGFIAKEVANGLDYAHRKRDIHGQALGIVHRDVSPQNVLISHSGEVKLVDFGIAKATMRARQTAVGVIKGKYYYMSPEQAWGENLDPRSDIFSTGILLYEMLTGQMLYLEEDLHTLLAMVRKADIAPPTTLRKGIPARLERIVMRALARKPENRYQTAADMASDLERFLHAHSPIFTPTKVTKWMDQVIGERKPLAAVHAAPVEPVDAKRSTKRISRDQLFLDGSEFTDHNSVIFDASDHMGDPEERAVSAGERDSFATIDHPDMVDGDDDAEMTHAIDRPVSRPVVAAAPQPQPLAVAPTHPDFDDISEQTVVSGPPTMASTMRTEKAPKLSRLPQRIAPRTPAVRPPSEVTDVNDMSLIGQDGEPTIPVDDDTTLPEHSPVGGLQGFDEATQVEAQPPTKPGRPGQPPRSPQQAPNWERAPALAAANPKPAVSAIRGPRQSRRTPKSMEAQTGSVLSSLLTGPGRVPRVAMSQPNPDTVAGQPRNSAQLFGQAGASGPGPDPVADARPRQSRPPDSSLQSFPRVAQQQNSRQTPSPSGMPRPAELMFPGANPALMNTSARFAAVEVDDIPDRYKLRRGGGSKLPWLIGVAVVAGLALIAVLATVLGDDGGAEKTGTARIDIVSSPEGGTVTIDGKELEKRTPAVFRGAIQGQKYVVMVELAGHQSWQSEQVIPEGEDRLKVIANLERLRVSLKVESTPTDAEVLLNGKFVGRTPLSLPDLDPGAAGELVLKRRNYLPVKRKLDWSEETEKSLSFVLKN